MIGVCRERSVEKLDQSKGQIMVEALDNDDLVHEAPAIVSCQFQPALEHKSWARCESSSRLDSGNEDSLVNEVSATAASQRVSHYASVDATNRANIVKD